MSDNGKSNSSKGSGNGADHDPQRLSDSVEMTTEVSDNGRDDLSQAKADVEKFKNEYLYLRAEFENFKRQTIKERSDLRKFGCERLVTDLLGVLDIFETALSTNVTPETLTTFRKGIDMTASELRSVLQRHGVSEVPSKGQPFDPAMHEALSSEETDQSPPGTITQVFKKPYKLHDRVVRPGQVVVSKPKA